MKVLIAGGGSGGHIFPAIALGQKLKENSPDIEILFVGGNKDLDRRIFEKEGFRFALLSANKLPYRASFAIVGFFFRLMLDTVRALAIVASYRPDAVVGFGGYIACPVILAAYIFRVPSVIHEQNVAPGRANAFLFKFAGKVALSFEETKRFMRDPLPGKTVFTGNPIRPEILIDKRALGIKSFGLDAKKFTILVVGGSQGAHFLNETFVSALSKMDKLERSGLQVIHLTGIKDYEWATKVTRDLGITYRVFSFIDRIEEAYSAADLIITRSGASAIFEIALFGKPMILVPYPFALSHQAENAHVFSAKGAAIELDERTLTAEVLLDNILSMLKDRTKLQKLGEAARKLSVRDASANLADVVINIGK